MMRDLMKKGCLLLLCLMLTSCNMKMSDNDLYEKIEKVLFSLAQENTIPKANMEKEYYSYYLPFDIKRTKSSMLSEELKCGNEKLIMNFKTISFIQKAFYSQKDEEDVIVDRYTEEELEEMMKEGILDLNDTSFQPNQKTEKENVDYEVKRTKVKKAIAFSGYYLANYSASHPYTLSVRIEYNMCYMYLDGDIATFACFVPKMECEDMLYRMFYILKSIEYDRTRIIKDYKLLYSLMQMEENIKEDLYEEAIPNSGYLEDLIQRQED